MNGNDESLLSVPAKNTLKVAKAISNACRLRILAMLEKGSMNVSEIARALHIRQPTATMHINQLEEAGLIFTRLEKHDTGYNKICYPLHRGIQVVWQNLETEAPVEYTIDMPVGHYSNVNCRIGSFLATPGRILASSDQPSLFFHPVRMDAELLCVSEGEVIYLFPLNIPDDVQVRSLSIRAEIGLAAPRGEAAEGSVNILVNERPVEHVQLVKPKTSEDMIQLPSWIPGELEATTSTFEWSIGTESESGRLRLKEFGLESSRPVAVRFRIAGTPSGPGGVLFLGKMFGRTNQDIRLTATYPARDTDSPEATRGPDTRLEVL